MPNVRITEVGPRDGLQSIRGVMSTPHKCSWIEQLARAGLPEIEVASFVPAKLLPQMADAAEVVRFSTQLKHITISALVPNVMGAKAAFSAGVHKVVIPVSASEAHSVANVRKTHAQMLQEVRAIIAERNAIDPAITIHIGLSTAFGCSIAGAVPEDDVVVLTRQLAELGVDAIGLADTTGYANPAQVKRLFARVRAEVGPLCKSAHLHNTRGLGLANALAAFEADIREFDSSMGGIGGCPFAPGASGNVVTEDLVFMFEAMGITTGVDLDALMKAREAFSAGLPDEPTYGMVAAAGLPKGFRSSRGNVMSNVPASAPQAEY